MSAIFTFLGGSVFRMIWGEVSSYLNKRQDHEHELARMQLEQTMAESRHARDMDMLKLQKDLDIKEITVKGDYELAKGDLDLFAEAVKSVGRKTGYKVVDIWNGIIRPMLATLAILVVIGEVIVAGFVLSEWTRELVSAILGVYVADRTLAKRGK